MTVVEVEVVIVVAIGAAILLSARRSGADAVRLVAL